MHNKKILLVFFLVFLLINPKLIIADEDIKFLSLKNNQVNLRKGPSFDYPIILIYKKKYLPVVIVDKSETWRKVTDFQNNSGWIHVSQLSRRSSAINIKNEAIFYKKPTIFSKPLAKLSVGRLVLIQKCKIKWCKIKTGNFKGWILKKYLWGKTS